MDENVTRKDFKEGGSLEETPTAGSETKSSFHCRHCDLTGFSEPNIIEVKLFGEEFSQPEEASYPSTLFVLECTACHCYHSLWCNEKWIAVEEFLSCSNTTKDGIQMVSSAYDHLCLWLLSQVCHNQQDLHLEAGESPFTPHSHDEYAKLMWVAGTAVGFYTLKLKGKPCGGNPFELYAMTMVDTIYIRKLHRRKGFGMQLLKEIFASFPEQNIGFSQPVSHALLYGLQSVLVQVRSLRDKIWLCTYTGEEGYRENAWFHIKALQERDP